MVRQVNLFFQEPILCALATPNPVLCQPHCPAFQNVLVFFTLQFLACSAGDYGSLGPRHHLRGRNRAKGATYNPPEGDFHVDCPSASGWQLNHGQSNSGYPSPKRTLTSRGKKARVSTASQNVQDLTSQSL